MGIIYFIAGSLVTRRWTAGRRYPHLGVINVNGLVSVGASVSARTARGHSLLISSRRPIRGGQPVPPDNARADPA